MKHKDKTEQLKEWEDTTEKQEFTYPMYFKSKYSKDIIEFTRLNTGRALYLSKDNPSGYAFGEVLDTWFEHTDKSIWEQVENPFIDEAIETVINEEYQKDEVVSDGSKNKFYEIPSWVKDLDDLSEYLDLRGDEFNCLKAIYGIAKARKGTSRHSSTGIKRDSNKLLHYSQRVQKRIHNNEDDTRLRDDTK